MKLLDFTEALRKYSNANELSFHSDGGYDYMIVDKTGRKLTPAALGINLDFTAECEGYARVDGNVYSHTATITPSSDVRDNGHIRNVTQYDNSDTVSVEGDIP